MIELKCCPFCGAVARLLVNKDGVKAMCTKCNCQTQTYDDVWLDNWIEGKQNAVEIAIEAWNKRVNERNINDRDSK